MTEENSNISLSDIDTDKVLAKHKLLLVIVSVLFMALIYLFVRYVSCAHKYHRELVELAYASLVDDPYIFKEYRDERGSQ